MFEFNPKMTQELEAICGVDYVHWNEEKKRAYGHDETEDLLFLPDVVICPTDTKMVSQVMRWATRYKIAVTVRGAGSGLAGGALPVEGGILMSMEKFDQILHIDERNFQVTVEPGVITEVLQNAVKEKGLFYPPDPASKGMCFIGGNVANNSGGPKAVKYGVVKDYVLNLEAVLPSGEVIWTGANTLKNSTGYNLTQLLVGSEGTLAVITKIVLKLLPHPTHDLLLLAPFYSATEACEAVAAIFKAGITPSGLEFMELSAIQKAKEYVGAVSFAIEDGIEAHLLIEVDGNDVSVLEKDCATIYEVLENYKTGEILYADNEAQKKELWTLRRHVSHAVKHTSIYKEEDTVVPRAELPALLTAVKSIGAKHGFESVCYGHAGDGNLHVNIIKGDLTDHQWDNELQHGIREIFEAVKKLGGTISGEHGIGWVQRQYLDVVFSPVEMNLQKQIKAVFDPFNILNPRKIFMD